MKLLGNALYAVYSVFFYAQFWVNTALAGLFVIGVTFLTRRQNFVYRVGVWWSRFNLFLTGVPVRVEGVRHIEPGQPYVVMANHQSLYDVWALIGYLPMQLRWVIKWELGKIPIFGVACRRMGHIFIKRGASEQARRSLDDAAKKIAGGVSVFFFPEGTRSLDGRLLKFKKGGFVAAHAAGVPILPITVNGGCAIHRRGSAKLRPGKMSIHVHAPIECPSDESGGRRAWIGLVKQAIASKLTACPCGGPRAAATPRDGFAENERADAAAELAALEHHNHDSSAAPTP